MSLSNVWRHFSVQFSRSVVSNSLRPHGLQHARLPCPSTTSGTCSNSRPLSRWCHPTISSSVVLFSSCLQSFPASGSFRWVSSSHQVARGLEFQLQHQSFQFQDWFPLGLTGLISLQFKGLLRVFSNITVQKHNSLVLSFLYGPTLPSIRYTAKWTFVGKVMSLLFNMLSRLVIAFLPRSKHLITSWLQSPSTVILEPKKIKSVTISIVYPSICHEVMGLDAMILGFECWVLSQLFHSPLSFSSRESLVLRFLP